jgi:hypothetical protein
VPTALAAKLGLNAKPETIKRKINITRGYFIKVPFSCYLVLS